MVTPGASMRSSQNAMPDDQLDLVFHALSDRTRRALIARLAEGPCKITDLAAPFHMSLPAVSKHLRVLESAQLVSRSIEGRVHRCSLIADPLEKADLWMNRYRSFWEDTLDALANYVERPKPRTRRSKP